MFRQINQRTEVKYRIQDKLEQYSTLMDDLRVNKYFQENRLEEDYADYLNKKIDFWRMNFHFVGFVKKVIVLSLLVLLGDSAEIAVIGYITVQAIYLILVLMIRPMVSLLLNILKALSEMGMLGILVALLMMFQSVNRIKE